MQRRFRVVVAAPGIDPERGANDTSIPLDPSRSHPTLGAGRALRAAGFEVIDAGGYAFDAAIAAVAIQEDADAVVVVAGLADASAASVDRIRDALLRCGGTEAATGVLLLAHAIDEAADSLCTRLGALLAERSLLPT